MNTRPDTYTIWILPRGAVKVREQGPTWDFDADVTDPAALKFRWSDVVSSIVDWVEMARPPMRLGHKTEDEHGQPLPTFGYVTKAFALTAAEAAAAGIDAPDLVDGIYATVQPTQKLADLRAAGMVGPTSPGLEAGFIDDRDRAWPIVVWEMSHTDGPRMRDRQPTPQSLLAAALADSRRSNKMGKRITLMDDLDEVATVATDEVVDQAAAGAAVSPDLAAAITALADIVTALAAKIDAMAGTTAVVEEMADEVEPVAITMADARRVAHEATVRELDARSLMSATLRDRVIPDSAIARLTELARVNRPAFDLAVTLASPRKRSPAVALSGVQSEEPLVKRARRLAESEKITLAEAASRLRNGV